VDTAGIDQRKQDPLLNQMMDQTWQAAREADLIFFLLDARTGITTDWMETAQWLRKSLSKQQQDVVVLANKLEGDFWNYEGSPMLEDLNEVSRMGFGPAIPISAIHGDGMADVARAIERAKNNKLERLGLLQEENDENDEDDPEEALHPPEIDKPLQLAILGRQNVGKSTLVNALLQQNRVLCGPTPGLTRDAIAIEWQYKGRKVQLVDTAGIRKLNRRESTVEDLAVQDAMRALKLADVAVLVLDAQATRLDRQELAIADAIVKEGRALVVAANKQDLLVNAEYSSKDFCKAVREHLETRYPMLRSTPIVTMSSLYGDNVEALMPIVLQARDRWARTISTGILNRWLKEVMHSHPPPYMKGRPTKIKYILQTNGRPPTFLLFCNQLELPVNYRRYLVRNFQDTFEYFGMEVRMVIRKSANPYQKEKRRSGFGVGGSEARKQKKIHLLKTTGTTMPKRRRRKRYHT
jgi:GTP-binding protein